MENYQFFMYLLIQDQKKGKVKIEDKKIKKNLTKMKNEKK